MKLERPSCELCLRPTRTCLCDLVQKVNSNIEVIIWQHPSEAGHPKGTAQLLYLCLPNSRLYVGEHYTASALGVRSSECALLYPEEEIQSGLKGCVERKPTHQLLVLDGTWRKSRKLLYLNTWLADLPRVNLPSEQSEYRIRKAEQPNQLSTFEAVQLGLKVLDPHARVGCLTTVFSAFVERYEKFIPTR